MSYLSGYDSEAVGFDSSTQQEADEQENTSQTTDNGPCYRSTQTSPDIECGTDPEPPQKLPDHNPDDLVKFLRRIVPAMMEQLDINEQERHLARADRLPTSSNDDAPVLVKELNLSEAEGSGDDVPAAVLNIVFGADDVIVASAAKTNHDTWCEHEGIIKVYNKDKVSQYKTKGCVSSVDCDARSTSLLVYGTCSGELTVINIRRKIHQVRISAPNCHNSRRISCVRCVDLDEYKGLHTVLSSSTDGYVCISSVDLNIGAMEVLVKTKITIFDISCLDVAFGSVIFGGGDGSLAVYAVKEDLEMCAKPQSHSSAVIGAAFLEDGVYASVSSDSELRVYNIMQMTPLKIIHISPAVSSVYWLSQGRVVLGLTTGGVKLYNVWDDTERNMTAGKGRPATAVAVQRGSTHRVAVGDDAAMLRVWALPEKI